MFHTYRRLPQVNSASIRSVIIRDPPKKKKKTKESTIKECDACFCVCRPRSRCLSLSSMQWLKHSYVTESKSKELHHAFAVRWVCCPQYRLKSWAATEPDIDPICRQLATTYYTQTRLSSSPSGHEHDLTPPPAAALRWDRRYWSVEIWSYVAIKHFSPWKKHECMDEGKTHAWSRTGRES